jgi:hypothetical protein
VRVYFLFDYICRERKEEKLGEVIYRGRKKRGEKERESNK